MDSAGKLISENNVPEIYGGSVLKLAGTLYPWSAGGSKGITYAIGGVKSSPWQILSATLRSKQRKVVMLLMQTTITTPPAMTINAGEAADGETTREAYDF